MKRFACGDVVPGCTASWTCRSEDEILHRVAAHAMAEHGIVTITDELVSAVCTNIKSAA